MRPRQLRLLTLKKPIGGLFFIALTRLVSACHDHPHADHADTEEAAERPDLAYTHWTDTSELFVELPALVVGEESPCAAHVTRLKDFKPLAAGKVVVVLSHPSGEERFASDAPSVPGIFRPVAKPAKAGKATLRFEVSGEAFNAVHDLGEVTIFESDEAARAGVPEAPEPPGKIVFLKEQQWPIAFGTEVVTKRALRESIAASASVKPRADGEVLITAPVAGRVASNGEQYPKRGERVDANDLLAYMAPRLESADVASLQLAVTSARLEHKQAERERARVNQLRKDGVISETRAEEAALAADNAKATRAAADRRLSQYRRIQRAGGRGHGTMKLPSPIAGTVTEVLVAPGAFVEAGTALFRVTDLTQLWLEVRVPEVDAGRLGAPTGASFWASGSDQRTEIGADAFVSRGPTIDPVSRTLPVVFSIDNAAAHLVAGASGQARLSVGEPRTVVAVPVSAIVDDGGTPVVFVQIEGEAFVRRIVRLGSTEQGYQEVLSGVSAGEHVATRGAWSVKLAASSGSVPAHGHAH